MSAYLGHLINPITGERVEEDDAYIPAEIDGGHVYPVPAYDLSRIRGLETTNEQGIFRYRPLLPVGEGPIVSLSEGATPVVPLTGLGSSLGLSSLFVKDESRNPTWSYKDRLAAVAVTKAVQQGRDTIVVSSTGNHGAAVAAYAARAGIRCVVLTLASTPLAMKTLMQSYGAQVVALGEPTDRWVLMRQLVEERGWAPMSGFVGPPSGSNPFGCEGYKTIAYELHAQLGDVPDVVVAPVAYGDAIAGLQRGFAELVALGLTARTPRLVASEPFGPYEKALRDGYQPRVSVPAGPSVSFSIATPMATWQGWNALALTGGAAASADDDMTLRAQHELAAKDGVFLEASSATTAAVLPELLARGDIASDESIVLIGTSTGLKDVPTTAARLPEVPVIGASLPELFSAIGEA